MERKDELLAVFKDIDEGKRSLVVNLIDDVIYMEQQLDELRKLPFILVKPDNPSRQKPTPAAKLYKETLQQYNNSIKLLCSVLNKTDTEDVSPLREYMKKLNRND